MDAETQDQEPPRVDGRRRRREQGRLAVIDAMIDLVLEGHSPPPADLVADRAGVSQASVFRYFATLDELRDEGVRRYFERYSELLEIPDIGEHSLTRRIENLIESRVRYHETTEPVARLARRQAYDVSKLRETLTRVRSTLTDQLSQHFEAELAPLRPAERRERLAVVAALTSFESWAQLCDQGLTPNQIRRSLRLSLALLLSPTT